MKRRIFINALCGASGLLVAPPVMANVMKATNVVPSDLIPVQPGVWRFTIGRPEKITPQSVRAIGPAVEQMKKLPTVDSCPAEAYGTVNDRGVLVKLPVKPDEFLYGLGLQLQSFQQRGLKKTLRVNADPLVDSGDSHAPVPFFVTTSGYGVLVDTARYAQFYMGNKKHKPMVQNSSVTEQDKREGVNESNLPYERDGLGVDSEVMIEIPRSQGVDIYIFAGPTMMQAVQRYNLFSGGGVLPPRWGLGFWYRVQSEFRQSEVMDMASYFRTNKIPCDVLGLEPRWQSHAYSCTYVWSDLFPDPRKMVSELKDQHFRINLWEHAFVHPKSPIYKDLMPHSGDYEVWDGLVPDFLTREGKRIFADFHKKEHADLGVSGYKADECDNSDFTGNWSFPELSRFPSGADGEQMHSLFGICYQDTIQSVYNQKNERTYGLVRSSGALAAPYPFVLYSDLYSHKQFIHAIPQSGFSGLLWTPEVRHATSNEDLIRRLQTVVCSPLAMVNAWYLKNAPWKQIDTKANNENLFAEDWSKLEDGCREIIRLRMKLIPYLHAAFVRYKHEGIPPFRALIMDYPTDPEVKNLSSEYLMGDSVLVAPVMEGEYSRKVYLPEGDWFDFWSLKKYTGKAEYLINAPLEQIPLFIRSGTILPLAKPTLHTDDPESWLLTVLVTGETPQSCVLYEGDDNTVNPDLTEVRLVWNSKKQEGKLERSGNAAPRQYAVKEWIWC